LVEIRNSIDFSDRADIKDARSNVIVVDMFRINTGASKFFLSFCFGPAKYSVLRRLNRTLKTYFTAPTWNLRNMNLGTKC